MFILLFLIGVCVCNPTTCLSELAIGYMAHNTLDKLGISQLSLVSETTTTTLDFKKFDSLDEFVKELWAAQSTYNLKLDSNNLEKWQQQLDDADSDTSKSIKNYLNGHDRVIYSLNKNGYIISDANTDPLKWKNNISNKDFNVDVSKMMHGFKLGYSDAIKLLSSINLKYGSDDVKDKTNNLLDNINERRLTKMGNTGMYSSTLKEDKLNDLAKKNNFKLIKAKIGSGKNSILSLSLDDSINLDDSKYMDDTFATKNDIKDGMISQKGKLKLEKSKGLIKIGINDEVIKDLKNLFSDENNISSLASKSEIDHAKLIQFTKSKNVINFSEDNDSDSKIKSISCKV